MTDLISRDAVVSLLENAPSLAGALLSLQNLTPARVRVVANITGGTLQGASSNYPAEIYTLDFDDRDDAILLSGDQVRCSSENCLVEPIFVQRVVDAPRVDDLCDECGEDASGGDGYNGLCGNCADVG